MPISVNPILPVIAAQNGAPELVLQPGTVIDAQVLKLLSDNLVRIAISSLSIDVLSEIPLQAGQILQLAVSQTPDGIRLAVVGQGAGPSVGTSSDTVALAPNAIADTAAIPSLGASPPPRIELTPLERMAVSVAAQSAATQQGSQAPLFANLGVAAAAGGLPPKLQQAVMQVLAQQTSLDQNLAGSDVKNAFQKSGLFLEASLASGPVSTAAGMPDLKAALIVLRQTLLSSLGTAESPTASATVAQQPVPGAPANSTTASLPHAEATSTPAPSLAPDLDVHEILLPQARLPVADETLEANSNGRIVLSATPVNAGPRAPTAGAALNLLQEALQELPRGVGNTSLAPATLKDGRRRRHLSYQHAASAISRSVALGATHCLAIDRPRCAAGNECASSA